MWTGKVQKTVFLAIFDVLVNMPSDGRFQTKYQIIVIFEQSQSKKYIWPNGSFKFVFRAFWRSNYSKSLSASEICNLHLNFFQEQGMLQPCRSNNLKNLIFKPSAAISVKIRDFRVFLAKPSLKNICDPLAIGICLYSVSEIKLMQNFVGKRNLRFVSSFYRNKLGLQAYRINILKTRLWETSGAILG